MTAQANTTLQQPSAPAAGGGDTATVEDAGGAGGGEIVATGTTSSTIMKANTPDFSMKFRPASVVPKDVDPSSLAGWAADPGEMAVPVDFENPAGRKIHLPIVVQWRYGGRLNGAGLYITGVSVFVDSGFTVGWFYRVTIDVALTGPRNVGAPGGGPIAAIDIQVEITITDQLPFGQEAKAIVEGAIQGDGAGTLQSRG